MNKKELKKAIKGRECYINVCGTETWVKTSQSEILYLHECVSGGAEVIVDATKDQQAYVSVEDL